MIRAGQALLDQPSRADLESHGTGGSTNFIGDGGGGIGGRGIQAISGRIRVKNNDGNILGGDGTGGAADSDSGGRLA